MSECSHTHGIVISNYKNFDTISYPVLLIKGYVKNCCRYSKLTIINTNSSNRETFNVSKSDGKFKCVVYLKEQTNNINIKYCYYKETLIVIYSPVRNDNYLKLLYIICKGHDGSFQSSTKENNAQIACNKIFVGIQLIQCLIAEKLNEQQLGRNTFHIEPECIPFYSQLDIDEARSMNEHQLWNYFAREIVAFDFGKFNKVKFVAFLGCTFFKGITDKNYSNENIKKHTVANAALGGGDLALFGTGCLYTWPNSISESIDSFQNEKLVDMALLMDDSNSRHTYGGCFATTLGSVCHEIGHILDLGHTENGIMGNGFDFINRVFTVDNLTEDLPTRVTNKNDLSTDRKPDKRLTSIKKGNNFLTKYHHQRDNDLTFFANNCAITLFFHKWIRCYKEEIQNTITYDFANKLVKSTNCAIRLVEGRDKSTALMKYYFPFLNKTIFEFKIPNNISLELYDIFIIDDNGNIEKFVCSTSNILEKSDAQNSHVQY